MKEGLSFGECLKSILASRELSVLESSRMLGMKSATSLSRIIHDEVNIKTLEKIYPRMVEAFSLTQMEKAQLERGLMIGRMGVEEYLGYKSMWQLLFPQKKDGNISPTRIHIMGGTGAPKPENVQALVEDLLKCARVEIVMVGCCSGEIIGAFCPLTERGGNIRMNHFLAGQKKTIQQFIGSIAAITPFLLCVILSRICT